TVIAGTPVDLRTALAEDIEMWSKVFKFAGIKDDYGGAGLRLVRTPAPDGVEQPDSRRDRDVEALDLSFHRHPHQEIAGLARETPHALAFGAQHPGNRIGQIGLVQRLLGALIGTDHPDILFLDLLE